MERTLVPAERRAFEVGACVDLGAFRKNDPDRGASRFLDGAHGTVDWIALMEDRRPEWFLGFRPGSDDLDVPLNRHGPESGRWTRAEVRALVGALRAHGVRVLVGVWMHECAWVDERHPELLMRDADGRLWQDVVRKNADVDPLKRLRADAEHGIEEGLPFVEYLVRQYAALRAAFGFEGLFVGDGGMGFREFAHDGRDALHFDFDAAAVADFARSDAYVAHEGCALRADGPSDAAELARRHAADVRAHHASAWLAWTRARWKAFYARLADAIHAHDGTLAAYNTMNYDPVLAREHGVDFRDLAEAGLDVLVFQTYDWAWGPHGPLTPQADKDAAANLAALLLTRGHVGHATPMRIVFTTETNDRVEGWRAPLDATLREIGAYGGARSFDGERWRPVADGTFVVWANDVAPDAWREMASAWRTAFRDTPPERAAVVWTDDVLDQPHEAGSYAHLRATLALTGGRPDGVVRGEARPPAPSASEAPLRTAPVARRR